MKGYSTNHTQLFQKIKKELNIQGDNFYRLAKSENNFSETCGPFQEWQEGGNFITLSKVVGKSGQLLFFMVTIYMVKPRSFR